MSFFIEQGPSSSGSQKSLRAAFQSIEQPIPAQGGCQNESKQDIDPS